MWLRGWWCLRLETTSSCLMWPGHDAWPPVWPGLARSVVAGFPEGRVRLRPLQPSLGSLTGPGPSGRLLSYTTVRAGLFRKRLCPDRQRPGAGSAPRGPCPLLQLTAWLCPEASEKHFWCPPAPWPRGDCSLRGQGAGSRILGTQDPGCPPQAVRPASPAFLKGDLSLQGWTRQGSGGPPGQGSRG